MPKRKRPSSKPKSAETHEEPTKPVDEKSYIFSDELDVKKPKWVNKQRVMVLAARGITARERHLMTNFKLLLPHSKSEPKLDSQRTDIYGDANEICEMRNCNKCILFVNKKRKDTYLWLSNVIKGPSVKFFVENIHTMGELNLEGNCLKGSRPLLSFDPEFDKHPHYALIKELFIQIFGTPYHYPKSKPFLDHIFTFTILDNRIWFRNYQIDKNDSSLIEIGPRFVLNVIRIFDGSFGGSVIYSNPKYVNPNIRRRLLKDAAKQKFKDKVLESLGRAERRPKGDAYADIDPLGYVFDTIPPEEAKGYQKNIFRRLKK